MRQEDALAQENLLTQSNVGKIVGYDVSTNNDDIFYIGGTDSSHVQKFNSIRIHHAVFWYMEEKEEQQEMMQIQVI